MLSPLVRGLLICSIALIVSWWQPTLASAQSTTQFIDSSFINNQTLMISQSADWPPAFWEWFLSLFTFWQSDQSPAQPSPLPTNHPELTPTPSPDPHPTPLSVPLLKQIDVRWNQEIYDRADTWSHVSTIARWGCALTSAAMIFQYYGLTTLPTGEELNPSTLNTWLIQQTDGYLGEGLVNWAALTRLSKHISLNTGQPALEYSSQSGSSLLSARDSIQHLQPVILQLPGHFVVGIGERPGHDNDFEIHDPAYSYNYLSQHQNPAPLSTRFFTPSHTDLSQIIITHPPELTITTAFLPEYPLSQLEPPQWQIFTEQLADIYQPTNTNQPLVIHELAKPKPGSYQVVVSRNANQPPIASPEETEEAVVSIYRYDSNGNPTLQLIPISQQQLDTTPTDESLSEVVVQVPSTASEAATELNEVAKNALTQFCQDWLAQYWWLAACWQFVVEKYPGLYVIMLGCKAIFGNS